MENHSLFFLLLLMLSYQTTKATQCIKRQSESDIFLYGFIIESSKVDHLSTCTSKCKKNKICSSINMNLMKMKCDLNYSTRKRHPKNMASQPSWVYMEIRDALGFTPRNPIQSCKWFKNLANRAKSGVYWMKFNEPSSAPFQVFCDMTTDGGGWTLVYSYTFTQFNSFNTGPNAVTPIPNWPVNASIGAWTPQSTTIPLSESSRSAMNFSLWKEIGNEFLLKPNITNWVACEEGTGSLVNWVKGSVSCRIVKAITPSCTTVTPSWLTLWPCGPVLGIYTPGVSVESNIRLHGRTDMCWPVHDPCITTSAANHLTNVPNPGGTIYVR